MTNNLRRNFFLFIACATVLSAAANANAQSTWAGYNIINQRITTIINGRMSGQTASRKCVYNCGDQSTSVGKATTSTTKSAPVTLKYSGRFKPSSGPSTASTEIANSLSEVPAERAQLKTVIEAVKTKYDSEALANGWQNNVAGGMTYFLIAMGTVYHDSGPTAEQQNALYLLINQVFDEAPELAKASDKDKQNLNDLLVGYTALPLVTYAEGKETGNAQTLKAAKLLAARMSQMIFKSDPVKF